MVASKSSAEDKVEDAAVSADDSSGSEGSDIKGWKIEFIPCEDVLCTGNEPYRIFRELQDLAKNE